MKGMNDMLMRKPSKRDMVLPIAALLAVLAMLSTPVHASDITKSCEAQSAVIAVHCTAVGLGELCRSQEYPEQCLKLIRDFIAPIRFYPDQTGYFYVYDYGCVNVAHATQCDLVGKDLYNYQDSQGKYVIRELADAAKKGGGFVTYHWVKPGSEGEKLKLGYVEPIPGTTYFIGTGVYEGSLGQPAQPADARLGEQLERDLWEHIQKNQWDSVDPTIAAAFQAVHRDGVRLADEERTFLHSVHPEEYELSGFTVTQEGPVMVVSYKAEETEMLDGKALPKRVSTHQSVWIKTAKDWQWLAHADLNPSEQPPAPR